MDNNRIVERIISKERLVPYLSMHNKDLINWATELNTVDETIDKYRKIIE